MPEVRRSAGKLSVPEGAINFDWSLLNWAEVKQVLRERAIIVSINRLSDFMALFVKLLYTLRSDKIRSYPRMVFPERSKDRFSSDHRLLRNIA
jgi:hypothetical protein